MKEFKNEIVALHVAEQRPVFVGEDNNEAEKNWKAVFNLDTNKVSAIVCKEYNIVQHRDVAQSFSDACAKLNINFKTKIRNSGDRFYMDVEFPDTKLYVSKDDEFIVGFRLINSYNTKTGVLIIPRLVRLICDNGMVIKSDKFVQTFNYRHNQEMAKNFSGYIEKALKETIDSNEKLKAMVNDCIGDSIEYDIAKKLIVAMLKAKKHIDQIEKLLEDKQEVTRWDIYNALTDYATHGQQLSVGVEMRLQGKAEKVLTTPFTELVKVIPEEDA